MKYIKEIIEENNTGCSDSEIKEIIDSFNENLPSAYIEFLKLMGKNFINIPPHVYADLGWKNLKRS